MGWMVKDFYTFPHKSLCPYFLPLWTGLPTFPVHMFPSSLLLVSLTCQGPLFPPEAHWYLSPCCCYHHSSFQPPSSATWPIGDTSSQVSLSPGSGFSGPPLHCPRARCPRQITVHIILSSETLSSCLCHLAGVSRHSLKGLDSKYFRPCKPNQRHYVGTYITF